MSTWTLEQVRNVEGLYGKVTIDPQALIDVDRDDLRAQFAPEVVEAARAFGVEVHPDDVALRVGDLDRTKFVHEARVYWSPGWRDGKVEVELRGGERNGDVFVVARDVLQRGLVVALSIPPAYAVEDAEPVAIGPAMRTRHYRMAGWREAERRWVMA